MGGKPQVVGTTFYRGWPLEASSKDFYLAIRGGLGWKKWLKNGPEKCFVFHAIISAYNFFGENFIGQVKEPLYSVCIQLNLRHEKAK